ncbi:ArsR family transcriptional regulator [candidate division KSB1 bacterium]|jgi:DNA-binding transcriptional ArsR family regulator|nr:MAG: ArsR family transcriptional regulator [candidate division KSB1 bacterium]
MLKSLITSETRVKLLMRLFLNPDLSGYLRQLAKEFGESTNSIRMELNKLTEAKILTVETQGRNKVYRANTKHPLFEDIRNIVVKSIGIDKVVSNILQKLGNVQLAFIRGDYAIGKDSGLIDLVVVGERINMQELERVRKKTETLIERKINVLTLTPQEYEKLKDTFARDPILVLLQEEK